MTIRSDAVERYLTEIRPPRDEVLAEMEELAERDGVPIVAWETGRLLAALAGALDGAVLEVGTAIGYSAVHIARALGAATLTTLERDPERIRQARDFFGRAGVADRVQIVEGDALDTIPALEGPFDLVFLDATKGEYGRYLELAMPTLSPRALLVVDNVLQSGQVADPAAGGRWSAESIEAQRDFNARVMADAGWWASVLPVGDGVLVASRRS